MDLSASAGRVGRRRRELGIWEAAAMVSWTPRMSGRDGGMGRADLPRGRSGGVGEGGNETDGRGSVGLERIGSFCCWGSKTKIWDGI